jgi:Flp pilus assembly protein TadD
VQAARRVADHALQARAHNTLGVAYDVTGRVRDSVDRYEDSVRLIRQTGSRYREARRRWGLGQAMRQLGEPEAARSHWRQALQILHDCGHLTEGELQTILAQPVPDPPIALQYDR